MYWAGCWKVKPASSCMLYSWPRRSSKSETWSIVSAVCITITSLWSWQIIQCSHHRTGTVHVCIIVHTRKHTRAQPLSREELCLFKASPSGCILGTCHSRHCRSCEDFVFRCTGRTRGHQRHRLQDTSSESPPAPSSTLPDWLELNRSHVSIFHQQPQLMRTTQESDFWVFPILPLQGSDTDQCLEIMNSIGTAVF